MPDRDGVEIYKRFYPWPDSFRLGDPVLIKEVTAMAWPEFTGALEAQNDAVDEALEMGKDPPQPDQVVLAGLIAVAFWQGNKQMTREKARRVIEVIPMDDIEVIESDREDDADPPAEAAQAAGELPSTTLRPSDESPEDIPQTVIPPVATSDGMNPNGSGLPGSVTSSPESSPT